jgi:hypothetical protein
MRKLSFLKGAFVILAVCCNLLLLRRSSADGEFDGTGEEVRDDRWGSSTADWQLISSSVTSASGPGVNTYMKSYPGRLSIRCNWEHFRVQYTPLFPFTRLMPQVSYFDKVLSSQRLEGLALSTSTLVSPWACSVTSI